MAADRNLRIRMLLEAADRFTRPMRALSQGSRAAGAAVKKTRDELKALDRVGGDIAHFRKLKVGIADTEKEMAAAQLKVRKLAGEISAADEPTAKLTREFAKAKREAAQLKDQHAREGAALQQLRGRLDGAGIATNRLAAGERKLRDRVAATTRELAIQERRLARVHRFDAAKGALQRGQEFTGRLFQAGVAKVTAGVGLATPVALVAKEAMDFESVMADVKKVVNFDDQARSMARLSDGVLLLSQRLPVEAEGIGQIVAAAGRSGIAEDALSAALRRRHGIQLSAAAADRVRSQALLGFAEDATKMSVAFDMTADDAGTMMATWRTAFAIDRVGVRRLGDQVNALTNKFGGNVVAANAMITRVGPLGRVAGIASGQIAGLAQMMTKLGIEEEVGATGIKNTLIALTRGAATTPHAEAAFERLGLTAVNVAKRMQKDAGGTITDVFTRISKLGKAEQVGVLTRLFGRESILAIAPLLTNLDQLKTNFALVADQSQYAGSMEREYASRAATSANEVQLANNNFKVLKTTVGTLLLPAIVSLARKTGGLLQVLTGFARAHPLLAKGMAITAAGMGALLVVLGGAGIVLSGMVPFFYALEVASIAFGIGMLPLSGIVLGVVAAVGVLAGAAYLIYSRWGAISGWFGSLWQRMKAEAGGGLLGIARLLTDFQPLGLIYMGFAAMLRWLGADVPLRMTDAGKALMMGLVRGIGAGLGWVKNSIVNVGAKVVGWFKQKLGIHSPSRVFHGLGGFMMTGLERGIAAGEQGPIGRVDDLARQLALSGRSSTADPAAAFRSRLQASSSKIAAALTLGAAVPPVASAPPAAAPGAAPFTMNLGDIHVHAAPGQDARAIAVTVRAEIERFFRDTAARSRSSYADVPDWRDDR